jgi:uncharacterized protein (DUF2235 family)
MFALVDLIEYVGLVKDPADIKQATEMGIQKNDPFSFDDLEPPTPEEQAAAKVFKATKSYSNFTIRFLGLFDIVPGTLNVLDISRVDLHSEVLSPAVETARHALSIDEHRETFVPLLWKPNTQVRSSQYWSLHFIYKV